MGCDCNYSHQVIFQYASDGLWKVHGWSGKCDASPSLFCFRR
jgi:hypothetical protein